ncbi:1-deoxy-D-xylulose-5-phosphate reductoisomerase [Allosphingosinicella vermicomposti]|uniref:1-deoxy-D-xylulose-5-phosphate reductoisomerase n=1 Tax=Allosphingosinicella vermicomposti TaxID=614671 RepID=UPI000D101327
MPRTVTILGATGSVGTSTLDLIERNRDAYDVLALTANTDADGLAQAAKRVGAKRAVVADERQLETLKANLVGTGIEAAAGEDEVVEAARMGADWTMAAIVGCAGLRPVMAALQGGKTVALANKESLVSAGTIMTQAARASGATLLPVDSEHNAIFQCFDPAQADRVGRIILTASGGPFRTWGREQMASVTPEQAVAHPNWSMGAKISVDSATLMNKGLELIEAFHLFPLEAEAFDVVVHPQSVIHSLVEYVDGSVLAQLGSPDMRIPIAYALGWPERIETPCQRLNLVEIANLSFEAPDTDRFPALALAREALIAGGAKPAILNAANEIAVAAFLDNRIAFLDIATIVRETMDALDPAPPSDLDGVFEVDKAARGEAARIAREYSR